MAKTSAINRQKKREKLVRKYAAKRQELKRQSKDQSLSAEERMAALQKLAKLPRNGAPTRLRNRCNLTGRPRGYYRKLGMSRVALRELASQGLIPGMVKLRNLEMRLLEEDSGHPPLRP